MTDALDITAEVRRHLAGHFADAGEPDSASVTFLGVERIEVLRYPGPDVTHFVSVGCARYPMVDPSAAAVDPVRGPRAEVVATLRGAAPGRGWARSLAVLAAAPVVDGLVLVPDALVDLSAPLWDGAAFTAFLLGRSEIADLPLPPPLDPVLFLSAVPITPTEAAWVRLKGAEAMREAWAQDGVDVRDAHRPASRPV
ncbi:suppressor of fused domain protein [Mycobacterium sp. MYCO198283]|uniref:suppressor of fused domain protein n=1 Tax=Mycobacterium sp. MYCO198283 TaxID=2883505 RepID=UPI001E3C81D3|nr:suppressor of fused domain protein [Mycobacterium sp. MYCO198283]MCG5430761.1 suppressor of fused domain protein [Mycobacterium sp. MYCO198283]